MVPIFLGRPKDGVYFQSNCKKLMRLNELFVSLMTADDDEFCSADGRSDPLCRS